jgi:hypothetical protein
MLKLSQTAPQRLSREQFLARQIELQQISEQAHWRAERAARVVVLLVLLGIYFGWLA